MKSESKLTLELPKSYSDLVKVVNHADLLTVSDCGYDRRDARIDIALSDLGLDDNEENLIVNIFLADEIKYVEKKYIWSIKGIFMSYVFINSNYDMFMVDKKADSTPLTESEFRAHLNSLDNDIPFEAFKQREV